MGMRTRGHLQSSPRLRSVSRPCRDGPGDHCQPRATVAGSGHYARLQPWVRFLPSSWNGSWNDAPN